MLLIVLLVCPLLGVSLTPTPPDTTTPLSFTSPTPGTGTDASLVDTTRVDVSPIVTSPVTPSEPTTAEPPVGCPKCNVGRCPQSVHECALNVGLVDDPCKCCDGGVCGLREGAQCFSERLAADLTNGARALGACGIGMRCTLRTDLSLTDNHEALCTCLETGLVCGTDNRTHPSSCHLSQESDSVWVKYHGPCRAAAWIVSPPDPEVSVPLGASVSLSCESKGYPTPRLHWERVDLVDHYDPLSYLPNDDSSMSVQLRGGPEPFMGSTWLQILETTRQHNGSYACVAVNSEGEARAITRLKVTSISEEPDAR